MISTLQGRIREIRECKDTDLDCLELSMCLTGIKLANTMKSDEAILLPELWQTFLSELETCQRLFAGVEPIEPEKLPINRWLLSRLYSYFGNLLEVQCTHRKYGSILLHRHCNLMKALSTALDKMHAYKQKVAELNCSSAKPDTEPLTITENN